MNNKNSEAMGTVGVFLLGIVSGILISAFMPMDKDKMRMLIERRKRKFREMMRERHHGMRRGSEWFTDDERRIYQAIKNKVVEKITDLNLAIEDVDKDQYIKLVQDAIREVQKKFSLPDDITEKMQDYWERNYERIKMDLEQ